MDIAELLNDKSLKPKEKTETLCKYLVDNKITIDELISFAKTAKDSPKATCIEAIEFATKNDPTIANENCLKFVSETLSEKAPRVKWESAKVIGNIAQVFPTKLDKAISNLLTNSEHTGTVVRWAAAFALGEIVKLNTKLNKELVPAIESICDHEEKNSIKKIYLDAIKKSKKQ
jgi:HEAT repeat protein